MCSALFVSCLQSNHNEWIAGLVYIQFQTAFNGTGQERSFIQSKILNLLLIDGILKVPRRDLNFSLRLARYSESGYPCRCIFDVS
jgi:hypothetical protein